MNNIPILSHTNHPNIHFKIWHEPEPGLFYAIGLDPAGENELGHPAVMQVWCDRPRRLCLEVRGHASEEEWAHQLYYIGKWYNWAYLNAEVYRYGRQIRGYLIYGNASYGIPSDRSYPNLYIMPTIGDLRAGRHHPSGKRFFYEATSATRKYLFDAIKEAVSELADSDEHNPVPDVSFIDDELDNLIINFRNNRDEAAPGATDDRIIAMGLAWLIFKQEPFDYNTPNAVTSPTEGIDESGNFFINVEQAYEESQWQANQNEVIYG